MNWNIFRLKYDKREEWAFEQMSYLLFCAEHNNRIGLFRYKNQTGIETEPLYKDGKILEFQSKYYTTSISVNKSDIIDSINKVKAKNENLNELYFYINQDGSSMKEVDAQDILDIALAGTSATLLAKRWESALLVNVDNDTLKRLLASPEAMQALMNIEGFRNLNSDLTTIINKSEAVKKAKKENPDPTPKEKKEISAEEKEMKSKRKQIQEKLIKFATRIPDLCT